MKAYTVLVAGHGKLAQEILEELKSPSVGGVIAWQNRGAGRSGRCMVVHAGSGRELGEIIEFCTATDSVLLELSTGETRLPDDPPFPAVICPNVNMQMLRFMAMIRHAAGYFSCSGITITESHQSSKNTKPGTALYLARAFGLSGQDIRSIRTASVQRDVLGIPEPFLDRHAYHEILIRDSDVEIRLESRVLGKTAYAAGLGAIIDMIARSGLCSGIHDVVDLVGKELLRRN